MASTSALANLSANAASGSLTLQNGATLSATTITNSGIVTVGTNSVLSCSTFTQTGGSTLLQGGTLLHQAPPVGGALDFNGNSDFVDMGNPAGNVLDVGTNATIETWVRFTALPSDLAMIVSKDAGPGNTNKWFLGYASNFDGVSHAAVFGINTPAGGFALPSSSTWVPVIGQWYHLAVVKSGNNYSFYVNGALDGTATSTVAVPTVPAPFEVGRGEGSFDFDGQAAEVRLWNVSRTPAQIQATLHVPLTGGQTGLVGYWPFTEGSGGTAFDHTANHDDGSLGDLVPADQPAWVSLLPLPAVNIQGGTLSGSGTIAGSLTNAGEVDLGSSPGTLTINGNYTQTAAGALNLEVGGPAAVCV
jgi:hypothetical protein